MGAGLASDAAMFPPVPRGPAAAEIPPIRQLPLHTNRIELTSYSHIPTSGESLDGLLRIEHNDNFGHVC